MSHLINIYKPETLNEQNIAFLLRSADDSEHMHLSVDAEGNLILHPQRLGLIYPIRVLSWAAGGDYSGCSAAEDVDWIQEILTNIKLASKTLFSTARLLADHRSIAFGAASDLNGLLKSLSPEIRAEVIREFARGHERDVLGALQSRNDR